MQVNLGRGIEFFRAQRDPVFWRRPREIILRQVRAVIGRRIIRANDCDLAAVALASQHVRCSVPRSATTDNDHPFRKPSARLPVCWLALGFGRPPANESLSIGPFNTPGGGRSQRRSPLQLSFSGAQAKACMVPRASHCISDDQPFTEWSSDQRVLKDEVEAWEADRNRKHAKANWQFTTTDARVQTEQVVPRAMNDSAD